MSRVIQTRRVGAALVWLALCLGVLTGPAMGEEPPEREVPPPPAADAPQIVHSDYWQARAAVHHARIRTARARLDEANEVVVRMRRRNHPRGAARDEIRMEQRLAESAYAREVQAFEVDLTAEAKAAGAQLRWLREPS